MTAVAAVSQVVGPQIPASAVPAPSGVVPHRFLMRVVPSAQLVELSLIGWYLGREDSESAVLVFSHLEALPGLLQL